MQQEFLNPEKWVNSGAEALQRLPTVCSRFNQQVAEVEHLALCFLDDDERGLAARILAAAGASPALVRQGFEKYARTQPQVSSRSPGAEASVMAGGSLLSLVQAANAQRSLLTDDFLSAEHVLLALLDDQRCGKTVLREAQPDLNVPTLRAAIDQVRKNRRITSRSQEATYEGARPTLSHRTRASTLDRIHDDCACAFVSQPSKSTRATSRRRPRTASSIR